MRKLTPRHYDVIRKLLVGHTPLEIADELGIHVVSIRNWQKEKIFIEELERMREEMNRKLVERKGVMERIQEACQTAMDICEGAVEGKIGDEQVPVAWRIKAAWDLLDRGGHSAIKKSLVGIFDPVQLVIEAHKEKHGMEDGNASQ